MKTNVTNTPRIAVRPRPFWPWIRMMAIIPAVVLSLLASGTSWADVLFGWDSSPAGGGGNGTSGSFGTFPWLPVTTAPGVTLTSGVNRGASILHSGSPANNAVGGSGGWSTTPSDNTSFTFTFTAASSGSVSLDSVIGYSRRSSTGPTSCAVDYSLNGGAYVNAGTFNTSSTSGTGSAFTVSLTGIPALQSVPAGTTITLRLNPVGTTGNWYLLNGTSALKVNGTVSVVVTPPSPPVANDAGAATSTAFIANWAPSAGATTYLLDVATDNGFSSFVSGYNGLDVGNVTNASVTGLTASTTYYYRVRASNTAGTSDNSNVKSITTSGTVAATKMTITLPGEASANAGTATPQTAGAAFNVTLTALLDDGTTVDTTYSGARSITFSGPAGSPVYPGSVTFSAGVGTASITLSKAESTTLTATDGLVTGIASSSLIVNPGIYTWTATTGTGSWTDSASWTPNRIAPGTDDILLFNQGGTSTATGVPAGSIASLQVSNNTAITLQAGGANTLAITGGANALSVATGSALNVSGGSALTISLPTGSVGSIGGAVDFAGGAHKLLAADANGITFQNGATFTVNTGFSSNPFGTTSLNSIVFTNGSTYVQKAGSNPFGASAPTSVVVFQTGSLYRIEASLSPSLSGRTYANLEINAAAFNQSPTGGNPLTMDNLTITAGTLNLNLTGAINIKGNVSVVSGSLSFTPATAGTVNFNGTTPQTVSNAGTLSFGATTTVNIAAGSTALFQGSVAAPGPINVDGTLGGSGTIAGTGAVTVSATGTLAPGASIGTLTFDTAPALNGINYFELDRSATPNADEVALTAGTLNFGGALTITNIGTALADGDTFTLFAAPTLGGTFTETNLPTLGGGLAWDTTNLGVTGVIKVVSTGTTPPPVSPSISKLIFSAGTVILSGTNNAGAGGTYQLLTSTNIALPRSSWTVVTNGAFDTSGNFALTNTVGTEKSRFFILQVP